MKTILFLSAVSLFGMAVNAQPVIQASDFYPSIGDSYTINESNYINPGPNGNNVTWDFSGLTSNASSTLNILAPDPTFPNTTHDFELVGQINTHLKLTPQAFELVAEVTPNEIINYSDPITIFQFPMTVGDMYTDTFDGIFDQGGFTIQRYGTIEVEVDGYGTIITPAGTFNNVLRIHSIRTVNDNFQGTVITSTIDMYQWIQAGTHTEIANIRTLTMPGNQISEALFSGGTVGLSDETLSPPLTLYPNPAQNSVSIQYDEQIDKVEVYDLNGRTVSAAFNAANYSIDISNLNPGIYYVTIFSNNSKSVQKLLKR